MSIRKPVLFCNAPAAARGGVIAAFALAALVCASPARATEGAAGLRVAKDPVTGRLRAPTADEAKALATQSRAKPRLGLLTGKTNPQPIQHPDGTVEQELDDSTLSFSVARRNRDGSIGLYEITGAMSAKQLVKAPQAAAKTGKERQHDRK